MKQPALGVAASGSIIVLSLLVVRLLGVDLFMGWASYALMAAIPFSIVVGAFWHGEEPAPIARLAQPARGAAYLAVAAVVAAIVSAVHLVRSGGTATPMAVMTIITSVVTTFFLAIILGGWPFTLIKNRLAGGISLLVSAYVVNAVIYQVFFNFGFASGAPWYQAALDPHGLFGAWDVVVTMVTSLAVMFGFLFVDVWPLTKLGLKGPALGFTWLAACLAIGALIVWIATGPLGIPGPTFMVRAPIPFIFGTILMLNMLGGSLLPKLAQPLKGLMGIVMALVLGEILAAAYGALMPVLSGALPAGSAGDFAAEVWLANALLAVTFPFLAFHGDFFGLWPLAKKDAPA